LLEGNVFVLADVEDWRVFTRWRFSGLEEGIRVRWQPGLQSFDEQRLHVFISIVYRGIEVLWRTGLG
jgi:hypothetical protein